MDDEDRLLAVGCDETSVIADEQFLYDYLKISETGSNKYSFASVFSVNPLAEAHCSIDTFELSIDNGQNYYDIDDVSGRIREFTNDPECEGITLC